MYAAPTTRVFPGASFNQKMSLGAVQCGAKRCNAVQCGATGEITSGLGHGMVMG